MTVMAAELGSGAVESEAADSVAAGQSATRTGGRTQQGSARQRAATRVVRATPQGRTASVVAKRTGGRTQQGTSGGRRASTAAPPRQRGAQGRGGGKPESLQKFPGGGTPTRSNYHGALLAEWAVGSLLIIAIPFSKPNQTGVSPYAGRDLVQLGTYTVVFWLLAIFAATGRTQARFAAWFGGLILLAVGLAEAGSIATAVKDWLGGGSSAASTQTSAAGTSTQTTGNPSVVNAPSTETATGIARAVAQAPGNGLT